MKNKINFAIAIMFLFLISSVIADIQSLPPVKQNACIQLKQICSNCTYNNISSIVLPNSTIIIPTALMTKSGTDYNYTFCQTNGLGNYIVNGFGDVSGVVTVWNYDFTVTQTGEKVSLSNIVIVLAFLFMAGIMFLLGYNFNTTQWIMKTFFYLCSLLFGLLALNSGKIIASESLDLGTMSTMGLILIISIISFMFVYMFIYWTIDTFKQIKNKKEIRWNY